MNKEFSGIFKEEFEKFIEFKKAQGVYKNIDNKLLYDYLHLNRFLNSYNLCEISITKEMFDTYMEKEVGHLSQSTRHHHECNFRQFSKFLKNEGYENIYIHYDTVVKMPRDYIPYVFSNEEMRKIGILTGGFHLPRTRLLAAQVSAIAGEDLRWFAAYGPHTHPDNWYDDPTGLDIILQELRKTAVFNA